MGRTPGCSGCEALLITGGPARPHTSECWDRIMKLLAETEDGQAKLARAESRMEQYRDIVAQSVSPESHLEILVPPTAEWSTEAGVLD